MRRSRLRRDLGGQVGGGCCGPVTDDAGGGNGEVDGLECCLGNRTAGLCGGLAKRGRGYQHLVQGIQAILSILNRKESNSGNWVLTKLKEGLKEQELKMGRSN